MAKCTRKKTNVAETRLKTKTSCSASPHPLDERGHGRPRRPPRPNPGSLQSLDLPVAIVPPSQLDHFDVEMA